MEDVNVLLTADFQIIDFREGYGNAESDWRGFAQAVTSMAILRRSDQLGRDD